MEETPWPVSCALPSSSATSMVISGAEPARRGPAERHAGEAVEHRAARADPRELPQRLIEEAVGDEFDRRGIIDEEQALSLQPGKVPAEALRDRPDLRRRLLQREEDPRLPPARPLEEEVQAHERLARPGAALDQSR